jgi:hypothetical protein
LEACGPDFKLRDTQSPTVAGSHSVNEKNFLLIFKNLKLRHCVHKRLPVNFNLRHINVFNTPCFKIYFNIINCHLAVDATRKNK